MKILYKYASRSRPERFFYGLDSIVKNAKHDHYIILCSFDADDETMNCRETSDALKKYDSVIPLFGTSKNKIDAINRDMEIVERWDILINMSDDMQFIKQGFDLDIIEDFGDNLDQFLHYPDDAQNDVATMSIIGKKYFDRFNYIYHPDYTSLWCDQEATETAKRLGCYKFINKKLFLHNHPVWKKASWDEQYKRTESFYHRDKETYLKRRAINFGL